MADSDKEPGATRALRKMECKHTHTHTHTDTHAHRHTRTHTHTHDQHHERTLAGRCGGVCNEPPRCRFCL